VLAGQAGRDLRWSLDTARTDLSQGVGCHLPTIGLHTSAGQNVSPNSSSFHPEPIFSSRRCTGRAGHLSRGLRGSCRKENTPAEQVEAGATVHLTLDQLEPGDLALRLAAAPGRREGRLDRSAVLLQPSRKVSRARTPDVRASASQVVNATRAASGSTFGLTPHPRTSALNRRASPATCAAVGSCSTRATRAASGPDSAAGGWMSSQASCGGDGNAGAPSCGAGLGAWAGALVRHWCGVDGAGAVRCSATQRCTCFAVPGKPAAHSSRQRASAFSQPSASRACKWAR
jgi:hypothetical protein